MQRKAISTPAYATPAAAPETSSGLPLHPEQIQAWRENGFALVDGLFAADLIERARAECLPFFPSPGSSESEEVTDYGSQGTMEFPSPSDSINEITLHPRLIGAVSQLLGVDVWDLRLTQSEPWAKYGRANRAGGRFDNQDQRMHVDYPNHTLTHPAEWDRPEAVSILIYYDAVEACGGATEFVPREGRDDPAYQGPLVRTPGMAGLEFVNDRTEAEAYLRGAAPDTAQWRAENLYARARSVHYQPGTVLFYRQDLWHRGTPMRPDAMRLMHNITFRRKDCEWISTVHQGWAWAMYRSSKVMVRLLAEGSVEQRCVLGFPEPGHAYWTRGTLDAVRARLEPWGMDMGPYEAAWAEGSKVPSEGDGMLAIDQLRRENTSLRQEVTILRAKLDRAP
jgi:hypothetical protein